MSAEPLDKLSGDLMSALDNLTNDVNRKILQVVLESGEIDVRKLHNLFEEHRGTTYRSFIAKIKMMETHHLLKCIYGQDEHMEKVRMSTFGEILLRGLLVAQKLLETKP